MNIFYLDHNPTICAQFHVDKHVVKMVTETAQLLSTAHRVLDGRCTPGRKDYILKDEKNNIYKATHVNHPCAIWVRQNDENYNWLYELFLSLLAEYTHRYKKQHACSRLVQVLAQPPERIPHGSFEHPPQCMPDNCKQQHPTDGYKVYYIQEKSHLFAWTNRSHPSWIVLQ